jgi:hypothetical protein
MSKEGADKDPAGFTRREALRHAARFGAAIAWTVPFIQTVDVRAAAAFAGSPAPDDHPANEGSIGSTNPPQIGTGGGAAPSSLQILDLRAGPNPLKLSRRDRVKIGFLVSAAASVRAEIVKRGHVVRTLAARQLIAFESLRTGWNGRNAHGGIVAPGRYLLVVTATDPHGNRVDSRLRIRVVS